MKTKTVFAIVACAAAAVNAAHADEEAANVAHVATDDYGRCFAHSIPDSYYEPGGKTYVYAVDEKMTLLRVYPWFAQQIYIACNVSDGEGIIAPALVQIGPWPRGRRPDDETLALAFYYNGETLAEYSTLDIAGGDPANVSCSVSHYVVIQHIDGFDPGYGAGDTLFRLTTVDGRRLTFSATTGALVKTEAGPPPAPHGACFPD